MINIALTLRNMLTSFVEGVLTFGQLLYDIFMGYGHFLSMPKWVGDFLSTLQAPDIFIEFLNGNWFAILFSKAFAVALFTIICFKLFFRIIQFVNPLT